MPTKATTVAEDRTGTAKRAVSGKHLNPRALQWPFDATGFTTLLRKEGVRAIGRIKGSREKLDVLIATLKVLGEHARVKAAAQVADAKQRAAALENRAAAEYERSLADQKREAARLRALADAAEAAVRAKEETPKTGGG